MALFSRSGGRAAAQSGNARPSRPAPASEGPAEEIPVEASSLRPPETGGEGRLLCSTTKLIGTGRRVVLRVSGIGDATFHLPGTVADVVRNASSRDLQVLVDEDRRGLLKRILAHLHGGAEMPKARAPRYRLALPAVVLTPGGSTYMSTFSISRGGCGLVWSGPRPKLGNVLYVRLGGGTSAPTVRGMVSWLRDERAGVRVGLRFVGGQEAQLASFLEAVRPGAVPH